MVIGIWHYVSSQKIKIAICYSLQTQTIHGTSTMTMAKPISH